MKRVAEAEYGMATSRARAGVGAWRWLVDGTFDEDVEKCTLRCGSSSRRTSPRAAMATQALAFCL